MKDDIFLLMDNDNIIASVIVTDKVIDDVYVIPSYQGKGIGKNIMKFAINKAIEKGNKTPNIGVLAWNKKAYNLYINLGFKEIKEIHYLRLFNKNFNTCSNE